MADSSNLRLGEIIVTPQERDAIHIAVVPVVAGQKLQAGDKVWMDGGRASLGAINSIGVVDPFLREAVHEGMTFWLFLNPGSITSLRHEWTHPDFDTAPPTSSVLPDKATSEAWLRDFIEHADCPDYHTVIAAAVNGTNAWDDEYMHFVGWDAHGDIPEEFWRHVEVVTGKKISMRPKFFSCSC